MSDNKQNQYPRVIMDIIDDYKFNPETVRRHKNRINMKIKLNALESRPILKGRDSYDEINKIECYLFHTLDKTRVHNRKKGYIQTGFDTLILGSELYKFYYDTDYVDSDDDYEDVTEEEE